MSRRTSIAKKLADNFKVINGLAPYKVNLFSNSSSKLKFWDEVQNFPSIFTVYGSETREYHPSGFSWGFLNVSIKVYCKGEFAQDELENLLEDIEKVIDNTNGVIVYDTVNNYSTSEISITSITTDEGLLLPYAVGEINLMVRYQIMK
jgi:hypothetical protein